MDEKTVLPIRKFAEEAQITDLDSLRGAAKKFGALFVVAGLEYVDRSRFEEGVQAELQQKVEKAARRAATKGASGRHYGLLKARIERAPALIAAKEGAVTAARRQVEGAQTRYEKARAKKILADLEAGLKRLRDNLTKDQADLDRLLDEEPE